MVYSEYTKQKILFFLFSWRAAILYAKLLTPKQRDTVFQGRYLKRSKEPVFMCRTPGSSRPTQLTTEMKRIVEEQMQADDVIWTNEA